MIRDALDVAMAGIPAGWSLERVERLEAGNGRWRATLWQAPEPDLPAFYGESIIGIGRDIPAAIRAAAFICSQSMFTTKESDNGGG